MRADRKIPWRLALLIGAVLLWPACERKHTNPLDPESAQYKAKPQTPAAPTAEAGFGRILIRWSPSQEEDVIGYGVYRSRSPEGPYVFIPGDSIALLTTGKTEYEDTDVSVGQTHYYKVSAVSAAGLESALSAYVYGTALPDQVAPGAPRDLVASVITGRINQARLAWKPPLEDEHGGNLTGIEGYKVYRSSGQPDSYLQMADVAAPAYTDSGLVPNVTYTYAVAAYDPRGNEGPRSPAFSVFIEGVAPPTGATAVGEPRQVRLSWDPSTDPGIAGYAVFRATRPDGTYTLLAGLSDIITTGESTYTDNGELKRGQTYYYRIASVSRSGVVGVPGAYVYAQVP